MIKWQPFIFYNKNYDLAHLHPFEMACKQAAFNGKPEKSYTFEVCFSLHCFTYKELSDTDTRLHYRDNRETRVFCFERYELSKKLPEIIRNIFEKNCYHTGHSNYFTVEFIDLHGKNTEYQVYFTVSKSSRRGVLTLYIQSAYPNTKQEGHKRKKPIRFRVIAHNTLHSLKIKPPA
jgi:hypothetical protein